VPAGERGGGTPPAGNVGIDEAFSSILLNLRDLDEIEEASSSILNLKALA
jgi:hypothetical protein